MTNLESYIADSVEGIKLKPCPFCGSSVLEMSKRECTGEVYIECCKCHIEQPLYPTYKDAIDAWNTRAECHNTAQWIPDGCVDRCSNCGASRTHQLYDDFCGGCGADMRESVAKECKT